MADGQVIQAVGNRARQQTEKYGAPVQRSSQ